MVFGLIGAGLQIAQTVKGAVDAGKAAKQAKGGGGEAAPKNAAEKKGGDAKKAEGNPVDRFLGMLNNPNVRTLADIKGVRDKVMNQLQQQGVKGDKLVNARRKLNQAVLKKLDLVPKNGKGDAEINLTPQVKKTLAYLGMKPDEVKGGNAGPNNAPKPPPKAPNRAAPGGKPG